MQEFEVNTQNVDDCILTHPRLAELVNMWGMEVSDLLFQWEQGTIPASRLPNHVAVHEHSLVRLAPTAIVDFPCDYPFDLVARFRDVVEQLRREVAGTQVPQ